MRPLLPDTIKIFACDCEKKIRRKSGQIKERKIKKEK